MDEITDKHIDEGWFDIARSGKWHGTQGGQAAAIEVTRDDLVQMAADYSSEIQEAPVTVDHIRSGPAHGRISELRVMGEKLQARLSQVSKQLRTALKSGSYRSRSIEMYKPHSMTGRAYLGALTFLGAKPAAVKGLRPVPQLFTEGAVNSLAWCEPGENQPSTTEEVIEMDEAAIKKTVTESVKDTLKSMFSFGEKPEGSGELANTKVELAEVKSQTAKLSESLAAEKKRADEAEAKLAEHEKAKELSEFKETIDAAKAESRITPVEADGYIALGEKLDGEGRKVLLAQVAERKDNKLLSEHGGKDGKGGGPAKFAEQRANAEARLTAKPDDETAKETLEICKFGEGDPNIKTFSEATKAYARTKVKS